MRGLAVRLLFVLLLASPLWMGVGVRPAYGAGYVITTLADNTNPDGQCSLREAILAANNAPANGDCGPGSPGDDTITFIMSGIIVLNSTLPAIVAGVGALTIDGGGVITISGNNSVQVMVVSSGATLTLKNLTIAKGYSWFGGGIGNFGTLTVTNSTFSGNSAVVGGGIGNFDTLTVTNSTFSGNHASDSGGGIGNFGTLTLRNTIIANSPSGGDCRGSLSAGSIHNLIEDSANACGLAHGVGGNIIGRDPKLGALIGNPAYFPLLPGSPAIDAGHNLTCAAQPVNNQSQNGVPRPQDGNGDGVAACDIGSYEALGGGEGAIQVETKEPQLSTEDPLHTVVLRGVVSTAGSTTAWFEWGEDPNALNQRTPMYAVKGQTEITTSLQLPPEDSMGRPFYYRIAAGDPFNPVRGGVQRILVLLGRPDDNLPNNLPIRKPPYWNRYDRLIHHYAHQAGWPAPVVKAILAHESNWDFHSCDPHCHYNNHPERSFLYEPVAIDWQWVYRGQSTPQVGDQLRPYLLPDNPPLMWPYNRHWDDFIAIPPNAWNLDMVGRCSFNDPSLEKKDPYYKPECQWWRSAMERARKEKGWTPQFDQDTYRKLYALTNLAISLETAQEIKGVQAQYRLASSYGLGQVIYWYHHKRVQRILNQSSLPLPETLYDPELNIRVAVDYLRELRNRPECAGSGIKETRWNNRGDWEIAVRGYNDGGCYGTGYPGNAFSHIEQLLQVSEPVLAPPDFDASIILAPTVTSQGAAASVGPLASPGEHEVDRLVADVKGLGQAQLLVLSVQITDPAQGADYGRLTIYTDAAGSAVEWESPPLEGVLAHGVVLTRTVPEGGPPLIVTLWGAGAHGTRAYLFRWNGQTYQNIPRVEPDGTQADDFFGDAGVHLGKGSIMTVHRDGQNPLDIFHGDIYAWDTVHQTFEWVGRETSSDEIRPQRPTSVAGAKGFSRHRSPVPRSWRRGR